MKPVKLILVVVLLSVAGFGSAWADNDHGHRYSHGHNHRHFEPRFNAHFGVVIGSYWSPWHSLTAYPYYPHVVVERYSPPVYIEQPAPPAPSTNYWYYCGAAKAYYPYVQECSSGWQKVLPQPPSQP